MSFTAKGECRNTGRTHFKKGVVPWNKGLTGIKRIRPIKIDRRLVGHPHTEETKEYLRKINLGKPSWAKGKKFSDEHKKKLSEATKKNGPMAWTYERWMKALPKIIVTAIKHELGGFNSPYNNHSWRKTRKKVYERDNYVCQECLRLCDRETGISCHHIDYNTDNNSLNNLITLCSSCHGKTTQKPDEWTQYYQDKMLLKNKGENKCLSTCCEN
jgi:hypothetical protein